MLTGFVLSFKIRANFGVDLFDGTTQYQFIRTLTMVTGEIDTGKMLLMDMDDVSHNYINYIIYFLFIGVMSTILLNLFVGIAVSDIKMVLDEVNSSRIWFFLFTVNLTII